jgi:acyl-CoA thioesterase-1
LAADPTHRVILVFGDSFTAGLGLSRHVAFPAQLESALRARGYAARVISAGVSGETSGAALTRLDRAVAEQPDIVIIELGANDALRGVQPAITRANLHKIITTLKTAGAAVLLTGMRAPTNWGAEYRQAFDRIYPELAAADAVPLYPFFLDGVALSRDLNQADTLHPNERGVAEIARRMTSVISRLYFDAPHQNGGAPNPQ